MTYLHGSGEIRLSIDVTATRARFAVRDEGDGLPVIEPCPDEHGGWGLQLVERIAERWGVETGSAHVWFEVPAQALSGTAA